MVYNAASAINETRELHRCRNDSSASGTRFLTSDGKNCEGFVVSEERIGWIATRPGGETLRALHRCLIPGAPANSSARTHALDIPCELPDGAVAVLGYVR